jgi:Tfp pilus assembly protein PilV
MLGVSGLQTVGMRNNKNAYLRSQLTSQVYNIMDRMRANMDAVIAGNYLFSGEGEYETGIPTAGNNCLRSQVGSNSEVTACTPTELAADDLADWISGLAARFPNGWLVNMTCVDAVVGDPDPCSAGSIHTIQIGIKERGDPSQTSGETQTLMVNMSLRP